jgi:Immunity protein 26
MLWQRPFIAVYDRRSQRQLSDDEIVTGRVLFVVAVFDRAYAGGRWPIVGHVPLEEADIPIPDRFMQDLFQPGECQIIDRFGRSRPARPEECVGLERAAVWEAEHVEERIRDHYAGRPNVHLEYMAVRL